MHEQLIGSINGDGGIMGITENPEALRRFMISGPELARIVEEFEQSTFQTTDSKHHEQYPKFQSKFKEDVKSLIKAFSNTGNPFLEDSKDLISLETSAIMPHEVVTNVINAKDNGRKLCDKFFSERIATADIAWSSTLHLNKLTLFSGNTQQCRKKSEITYLKEERNQVVKMMLSGQEGRNIDEDVFLMKIMNSHHLLLLKGECIMAQSQKSSNAWNQVFLLPILLQKLMSSS